MSSVNTLQPTADENCSFCCNVFEFQLPLVLWENLMRLKFCSGFWTISTILQFDVQHRPSDQTAVNVFRHIQLYGFSGGCSLKWFSFFSLQPHHWSLLPHTQIPGTWHKASLCIWWNPPWRKDTRCKETFDSPCPQTPSCPTFMCQGDDVHILTSLAHISCTANLIDRYCSWLCPCVLVFVSKITPKPLDSFK